MRRPVALLVARVFATGLGGSSTAWAQAKDASKAKDAAKKEARLDINTASLEELRAVPGLGPV